MFIYQCLSIEVDNIFLRQENKKYLVYKLAMVVNLPLSQIIIILRTIKRTKRRKERTQIEPI